MQAIRDEVIGFAMPGAGMADFARKSVAIAKAGIYDLRLHHDDVVQPVLRFWRVFDRNDFGPDGEKAREELAEFLVDLDRRAARFVEQRERARARSEATGRQETVVAG
jgi:acyl-[acyl-carrier-protein] desaturase